MTSAEDLFVSVERSGYGLTPAELLAQHPGVSRRTAQRWIQGLVREGRLAGLGEGRARRYLAATPPLTIRERDESDFGDMIPLSEDSRDILAYVDRPMSARQPVSYQREFLEEYEPNSTCYLPAALRRQLRRIGDTGNADRPAGTHGRAILNRLLIDLSWASSQLEGNTYSLLDTRELIEHGRAACGKAPAETQMILNHKAAIELLIDDVDSAGFDRHTIFNLHSALSENLLPHSEDEGRLRQHAVMIGRSVYRPLWMAARVEESFDLFIAKASRIEDPFEQSFFAMVHLPYLQPFIDVNKRTSRLLANLPLLRANLCPLTFLDVPERAYTRATLGVYELTRVELLRDLYMWAYGHSATKYGALRRELVEPDPARLAYRLLIRQAVRDVVTRVDEDSMSVIEAHVVQAQLPDEEARGELRALIISELRGLHEGALARYGLRLSELARWRERR